VIKPVRPVSLYGSYTVSSLPSSGDQFSSLTTVTEQLKPEKFTNYEVGAKWESLADDRRLSTRPDEHPIHGPQRSYEDHSDGWATHQWS
jgi:outer membrane receptor for monomeric catechols